MPLLERGYKTAAIAELERGIRKLEEKKKKAKKKAELEESAAEMQNNLNFAERIGLITAMQAEAYRCRVLAILALRREIDRIEEGERRDNLADGYEGQHERTARYQDMDNYKARIAQDRAKDQEAAKTASATSLMAAQESLEHKR